MVFTWILERAKGGSVMADTFTLTYEGGEANQNRMDVYDYSISIHGLSRTLSILGQYYINGQIIHHAPKSNAKIYIYPPEEGSFKQTVAVAAVSSIIGASFGVFATKVIDYWLPTPDQQMEQVIEILRDQNKILLEMAARRVGDESRVAEEERNAEEFIEENKTELQVVRSISANSFKDIFRPVGRSVDYISIVEGPWRRPISSVDQIAVARIESERMDYEEEVVVGVVNSFSRSSKTGIIFWHLEGRGIPFEVIQPGKLPREDDFSWSQYSGKEIELIGNFVYWFDGSVKKFLVRRWGVND